MNSSLLSPFAPENVASRDGFGRPIPHASLLILHAQGNMFVIVASKGNLARSSMLPLLSSFVSFDDSFHVFVVVHFVLKASSKVNRSKNHF